MEISTLGIDLAKDVFQLHGNDSHGKCVLRKKLNRSSLKRYIVQLKPCVIAMEACSSSNFWAREFIKMGHTVKLISPQFVKPFVKSNKNDSADAEAIAEAMSRPNMRFVSIKEIWQQEIQSLHRSREFNVQFRTALSNSIRGMLQEYGVVMVKGIHNLKKAIPEILEKPELLTSVVREIIQNKFEQLKTLEIEIKILELKINHIAKTNEDCKRIQKIAGIGPITATAAVSAIGDPHNFKNGRQFAAWVGLVPRQHSSGGKEMLLGISKRGDTYLRKLLVLGAKSAVNKAGLVDSKRNRWILEKIKTRGPNKTCVALANRNARTIWALLAHKEEYIAA